jgi:hypothetical protein
MNTEKKVKVLKTKKQLVVQEEEKVDEKVVELPDLEPLEELQEDIISNTSSNTDEDVDEELAEQERIIKEAMEKAEHLRMKKQLLNRSGEFLEKLKETKNAELLTITDELRKVIKQKEKLEEEVETLEGINVEEDDVMGFLTENYADFVNGIAFPKTEEPKPKAKPSVEGEKPKGTRTAIDRKSYPDYLLDRMVFQASANHKTDKGLGKVTLEVVFNAETKKFYNRATKKEYALLQDANRDWCFSRGYDKLGNAWEDFKAYNLKTKQTKGIQLLHKDNWIADSISGAAEYIDKKFKF